MILKFKTNINCGGCIASVSPHLDKLEGLEWDVDTAAQDKIMTISGGDYSAEQVMDAVTSAGFKIVPVRKKRFGFL